MGVSGFDIERFDADFAYTLDGGPVGSCDFECFNAASAAITVNGKKLVNNADYKLRYKNNVNVGVATMTVTGMGSYTDERTFNFVIDKGPNPMKVSGKAVTVKYSKLKRKNQTVKAAKAFAVTKVGGKTSYTKLSGDKRVIINKKSGLITVKKGMKKDLYKLKVRVSVPESANFYAFAKDVVVKVRVK